MAYGQGYAGGYADAEEAAAPEPQPTQPCVALGYGGLAYSNVGYAGGDTCTSSLDTPDFTPDQQSNVLNVNDSRGRLGCGVPSFFITGRCSTRVTCILDDYVSDANWDRRLDDVSEAEVTCQFGGTAEFTCCECLAETEPWCHELNIWRDGEEVWVGPIQEIEYTYDSVRIRANDSLIRMGVRIPPANIDFTVTVPGPQVPPGPMTLTDIAQELIEIAFAEDSPEFTCEVDNIFKNGTGLLPTERFFEQYNQTALEILRDLADTGLNFTVLGRTIVLTGDENPLTPLVLLTDEHIVGNISVTKDGTVQGNRFYVHFDEDGGIPVSGEATEKYCYGVIERIRDGDGLTSGVDAASVADTYVLASTIAPRTIVIPSGSKLSPETPWTINQMVPGARVDVSITKLCLNLTQSFILTGMQAEYSSEGESISVELSPINSVVE